MDDGHERRDDRHGVASNGDVFEAAFRRSSTPTLMIDLRSGAGFGRIIEMNDAADALLGRSRGELIGRDATTLIPEQLRPTLARNLRLLAGTRRFRRTAARRRVVHADGRVIEVWMSSNPIPDESGTVAFVWTELEDLARAQEHRAIVGTTERRYLRAFEDAPVAIAWLRLDGPDAGRFLRANGAFTRAVGHAEADLTAMRAADLAVGQPDLFDPDRIRNVLDATGGATTHATCQIRHGSGDLRWMRFSFGVQRDDSAAIEAAIVHAEDITATREAQIAARVVRERHATVFAQAPTALLLIDLTTERLGCVLEANPAAAALFGYDVSVLVGMFVPDLTHPDDRDRGKELMGSVAANAAPIQRAERRYLHASGRTINAEANLAVVPDEHGRARYGIAQIVDVTEQRATEARLRQAERLESVGRLAGGIADDVNNLLAATMGYANLLTLELNELAAADEASRAIIERLLVDAHEIEKVALRGAGLTRQLLTFSRGDPSPTTVVDFNAVLVEMRSLVERSIGEDITVQWDLAAVPTPVLAGRAQLEQLVMNLVLNARDAMPLGGSLRVNTSLTAPPAGDAQRGDGAPPISGSVQLLVSDSGSGMSSQEIDRAFEPFFTTKPPGHGNGLGLATVYGIVQAASGSITITSDAGSGTSVQVLLPYCDGPLSARPEGAPSEQRRQASATVLLVEDEPAVRRPTAELLRQHGFVVLTASDASEAIEHARDADGIDILVSDLVLPGRSGRELAIELRRDLPGLPVVFVSGYSDEVIAKHGTIEPHDVLLAKPFTIDALLAAMSQLLETTGVTATVG